MITKVALNSQLIQYFMIDLSTLTSGTIISEIVQRRIMLLSYIPTEDQDVDILTKALTRSKFEYHRGRIGVADNPYPVEREC